MKRTWVGANCAQTLRVRLRSLYRSGRLGRANRREMVRRPQRVGPKRMFDVGDQQFLVLLFVIDAQFRQLEHAARGCVGSQQLVHVLIDMASILLHFIQSRTRKRVAQRLVRLLTYGVVIGVEKIAELWIQSAIAGQVLGNDESLKEPGGMGQMPFCWTGVRARLHHLIFGSERSRQGIGLPAASVVALRQAGCWYPRRRRRAGG